jgi:hypothetical protein
VASNRASPASSPQFRHLPKIGAASGENPQRDYKRRAFRRRNPRKSFIRHEAASARSLCPTPGERRARSWPSEKTRSAKGYRHCPGERSWRRCSRRSLRPYKAPTPWQMSIAIRMLGLAAHVPAKFMEAASAPNSPPIPVATNLRKPALSRFGWRKVRRNHIRG